ncbi:MAG TPA: sulfurtransferase TusA family protein [Candidatus Marinimicrobia bacterium]|jgi:tRNA 2-thiouridine synthesizing protein A|nr:sulfurtransferase TusA family protein [Candidatus Neomarinimicrobiota bacterium]HIC36362.1 sulfurtransferase TusA family protein [Candidatus Neomarinimicrobiota bacterium]
MNKIDYNKKLDCTGLNCPLPILKTKKQIDAMETGQILKMEATDPGSINDVIAWTRRTGNELVSQTEDGDIYIFYIKKS